MLVDTHCHINMMVKKEFDVPLTAVQVHNAAEIIEQARKHDVLYILNVGTSLIESENCVNLAQTFPECFATVGIHPNDCTSSWQDDFKKIQQQWFTPSKQSYKEFKIIGIGECGIDRHYPGYNLQRQIDAFKAQIELALEYDLALSVHSRDATDETLKVVQEFKNEKIRGVMHCFSEDLPIAQEYIALGFVLGIGGTITYPKNESLRTVVKTVPLEKIILETDAPFLPPQSMRGQQNHPKYIEVIAQFIADLKNITMDEVATVTSNTACRLFNLHKE